MKEEVRNGPWYAIRRCVACPYEFKPIYGSYTEEGNHEAKTSNGVCPECGHVSSGTICETVKVAERKIYERRSPRWWGRFLRPRVYTERKSNI